MAYKKALDRSRSVYNKLQYLWGNYNFITRSVLLIFIVINYKWQVSESKKCKNNISAFIGTVKNIKYFF